MPRYTISRHIDPSRSEHFDLFLEIGSSLRTWRLTSIDFKKMQSAHKIKNHRKKYLDFEGELGDDRGRVEIWDTGDFHMDAESKIHHRLAMSGEKVRTRLCLERRGDETSDQQEWLLYDGAQKLRRLLAQHFHRDPVPEPESPELLEVHGDLYAWEKTLTAVADRFVRGKKVDWSQVDADAGIARRIRELRARWVHPWLVQAYRFAMRLDRWTRHMRSYRLIKQT